MVAGFMAGGWRNMNTDTHSTWELHQEVQVHFQRIWQQKRRLPEYINRL